MAIKASEYIAAAGYTPTEQNSNYTATNNDLVLADTSGGAFEVTLPASPAAGEKVTIVDSKGNWATANLTVNRNGSNIDGAASNYTCDGTTPVIQFIYGGDATEGWVVDVGGGGSGGGGSAYSDQLSGVDWVADGDLYKATVTHNLGSEDVLCQVKYTGTKTFMSPYDIEIINSNSLYVWMNVNTEDLTAVVIG